MVKVRIVNSNAGSPVDRWVAQIPRAGDAVLVGDAWESVDYVSIRAFAVPPQDDAVVADVMITHNPRCCR